MNGWVVGMTMRRRALSRAGRREMWRVIDQPLTLKGTDARDILNVRGKTAHASGCYC